MHILWLKLCMQVIEYSSIYSTLQLHRKPEGRIMAMNCPCPHGHNSLDRHAGFILLMPVILSQPRTEPFSTLHYSLMKTLTMMIGEFETDSLLYSVPSIILFPFTTYSLWIIFVLVMSILMQNLLVGK